MVINFKKMIRSGLFLITEGRTQRDQKLQEKLRRRHNKR